MKKILLFFIYLSSIANLSVAQNKISKQDFNELFSFMSGSFSSEVQSKNDTDYFDIRLHMSPIWSDSKQESWLYVEQAMSSTLENPIVSVSTSWYRRMMRRLKVLFIP
ncbi:MAG: hypothetical protein IPP71_05250 [Bacteroidetes bacterium]|nr:hypothetical protein [Bacteroidota bacterium]